ncbi:hypothetical protein D1AOALGA4SA_6359 [Olavius algarvensis Delta 1 endosymbiont]|nr:hypothetical protein D1AOALGA4SA_6359 [Olavius algarvensis Delta 1 endosymbiont]
MEKTKNKVSGARFQVSVLSPVTGKKAQIRLKKKPCHF